MAGKGDVVLVVVSDKMISSFFTLLLVVCELVYLFSFYTDGKMEAPIAFMFIFVCVRVFSSFNFRKIMNSNGT